MALEQRNGIGILSSCSSMIDTDTMSDNVAELSICSESMFMSSSGVDPLYISGWNTMVSGNQPQIQFANPHYPVVLENQTMGSNSDLVQLTSDSGLVDHIVTNIPSFGSGSFSEMVSPFAPLDESGCHSNFPRNLEVGIQTASIDNTNSHEHCQNSKHGILGVSVNAKRKRKVSDGASCKNVEVEQQTDHTDGSSEFPKADEKKNIGANSESKEAGKQAKDNSNGAEPSKENYILVRAKRGQATSSHSLAEKVRREKINERMRLLQELVPGCDKITGKAVMLDEIVNYVQSLQQQVEFLSMKLATLNPELNVDTEQIFSRDLLYQPVSNGTGPGLNSSHALPILSQGTINFLPGTATPLPQNNELQSILQMEFDSDPSISSLQENRSSEMEL